MENKNEKKEIFEESLKQVSGGKSDEIEWNFGKSVNIDSVDQNCPDCGHTGFTMVEKRGSRGYDIFVCICGSYFQHKFEGDKWFRAYKS